MSSSVNSDDESGRLHTYTGIDAQAEKTIRNLARTLTAQSLNSTNSNNNNNNNSKGNDDPENPSSLNDHQSIFSNLEGINPVFTNPEESGYDEKLDPTSDYFSSTAWVKNMARLAKADPDYYKPYSMGCVWKDLTASGTSSDIEYQSTALNAPIKALSYLYREVKPVNEENSFQILKEMEGCINPGELVVVLGRPGSGCTTLLKTISTNTHGFHVGKNSTISYSGFTPKEIIKHYRGEVVYNAETDIHLPHLTVYQTLYTVSRLKTPQNRIKGVDRDSFAKHITEVAMATYGLSHTRDTKVGNDLVRGVSGGERKRVSIAEVSICGSKFQCWDNATRGLDSATALEFIRALKTDATTANSCSTVAIYQCSQDAYDLFDKVCVLDQGYQIYFGPGTKAKAYFEKMGYVSPDRQTTADFLTAVTSPAERILNEEYLKKGISIPQTPEDMNKYWKQSQDYKDLMGEIDEKLNNNVDDSRELVKEAHIAKQSNRSRPSSPYTVNYFLQVKYLLTRNIWRIKNNPSVNLFMVFGNSSMALILGSMFYKVMLHESTATFYFRGSAMFFAILFNAFSCLLEIFTLYEARPITEKHKTYSLYHPSADAFASIISELPTKAAIAVCFNIIFYFLVNFKRNGGNFFFYLLINIVAVFSMSHMFRTVGAATRTLSEAMFPASMLLLAMSMYTGFAIPKTKMLGWSEWIWYLNPLAYLFESLMINEFHDRDFTCAQYVPQGPAYVNATGTERVCISLGAVPGEDFVNGDDYIKANYGYEHKHKWRGFGVGMAFAIFFLGAYLAVCEFNEGAKQKGEILVFPQSVIRKMKKTGQLPQRARPDHREEDLEKGTTDESSVNDKKLLEDSEISSEENKEESVGLSKSTAIFHWRNLCYDVQIKDETRRILSDVDGWVRPGTLTALMGASGAGKTTLLNCLAERVTMGTITGDVFVDGRPRDESFPRSIGYCQQQDLHLRTSTVRESLRFSAYLRQPADVSVEEKNSYVEEIINILEMDNYADAIVGIPGEGLNVEQRKRLTIGVELAAKPKLLVFLDEPTSGLDSQTAWAICQLMRKLASHGQAILCTIHQPSAILMQEFDRLLFLQRGGKTVYFGELGHGCQKMIDYFESNGSHKCPPDANPAEWMLEVVGAAPGSHANQDYYEVWRNSDHFKAVHNELDRMEKELPGQAKEEDDPSAHKEFATAIPYQINLVSERLFQQYWRSPQYLWSKFILTIFNMLFIGFTFFKANTSLQGLQNEMLAIFMFTVIFNPLLQQYLPNFVEQRDLYEARERPSRTFSWKAFIVSQILVEVFWNFLAGSLAYFIYYYAIGFYHNASVAGQLHERGALFWLFSTAFFVYCGSMGTMAISFIEIAENAANMASLMFTICLSFCGVMVTKDAMPRFWIFMFRVSPLTYMIEALLAIGVGNVDIVCTKNEFVEFTPAPGMTCGEYLAPYLEYAGTGYLRDNNATDVCGLCEYSHTNDYLATVNAEYDQRWRNYGIFICYIFIDFAAAILFYYLARVPKKQKKLKTE